MDNEQRWKEWYSGNFTSLFDQPTIANGGRLVGNPQGIPIFQIASDFAAEAAYAEGPSFSADDPAVNEWLEENYYALDKAIQRAVRHWSIADVAVLSAQPELVEAVDPIYYFRVGSPDQPDKFVGHIIASRYIERSAPEQLLPEIKTTPNRIKVVKFRDGVGYEQVLEYHPNIVGQPLTPLRISPIKAICVSGSWNSWYSGIRNLAAQLLTGMAVQNLQLNRYANRITYVPVQALDGIRDDVTLASGTRPTAQAVMSAFKELPYPVVGLTPGPDGNYDVPPESVYSEDFQSREAFLDRLWDTFYLASGTSPQSYGINIGKGESGFAREKAQDAASARIRAFRRDMAECLPTITRAMGCPDGDQTWQWTSPPFQNREAHTSEVVKLLAAGIITIEEARRSLGWSTDASEVAQPQPQAGPVDTRTSGNQGGNGNA